MTHIRVITAHVSPRSNKECEYEDLCKEGHKVTCSQIQDGPPCIEGELHSALAVPGIVRECLAAERDGVDAIVIDCVGDPGLVAAREAVRIPVIGPGEASVHLASMLARKFSVLAPSPNVVPLIEEKCRLYGLENRLASAVAIDATVSDVVSGSHEGLLNQLVTVGANCVEEHGAGALIIGCTGFVGYAPQIADRLLSRKLDVPVISPLRTALRFAQCISSLGLRHSPKSYPFASMIVSGL